MINNSKIEDALIIGSTFFPLYSQGNNYYSSYTFTNETGNFSISTFDPFYGTNTPIFQIQISCIGCNRVYRNSLDNNFLPVQNNQIYTVEQHKFTYDNSLTNITISGNNAFNLQGYNSLTLKDITVLSQQNIDLDISAREFISIISECEFNVGNEVDIYLSETFPNCIYYNYPDNIRLGNSLETTEYSQEKMNETNSGRESYSLQNTFSVSPNPTMDLLYINYTNEDNNNDLISYSLLNITGSLLVTNTCISGANIDVGFLPKGVYFLKLRKDSNTEVHKIIKL